MSDEYVILIHETGRDYEDALARCEWFYWNSLPRLAQRFPWRAF
jgi:hypothetical protein